MRRKHALYFAQVGHLGEGLCQLHATLGFQIVVRNAASDSRTDDHSKAGKCIRASIHVGHVG